MTPFDVFLLDSTAGNCAIALARRGDDTAIETIELDNSLVELLEFGRMIGRAVTGNGQRPDAKALDDFGNRLFGFLFRGTLGDLYRRLPKGPVSVQVLANRSDLQEIPWEYLSLPDRLPSPHRERGIVRIQPTVGVYGTSHKRRRGKIRVLFVSADPIDQDGVDWTQVKEVLDRTLAAQLPSGVTIEVVEGATRAGVLAAVTRRRFDVFHFFGHGTLSGNNGYLVLQDTHSKKSDLLPAEELAVALAGRGTSLALLSACLTSAGNHDSKFGVVATALIRAGIPAVVANQYSIPIKSISPFVGAVYSSLAKGETIDEAVANGRVALKLGLAGTMGDRAVLEWGIPTLYRLANSHRLFGATS